MYELFACKNFLCTDMQSFDKYPDYHSVLSRSITFLITAVYCMFQSTGNKKERMHELRLSVNFCPKLNI